MSDTIVVIDPRYMEKIASQVHAALNKHSPPAIGFIILAFEEREGSTQQTVGSTDTEETIERLRRQADYLERSLREAS